ncbi:MAG: DUF998 domain-containing protein [Euryarchaeota archaeon]|nr:DUF998 domain-containing protein [Euryarchaeota archaeon]MDE1836460.1 DUF998 domain-containing protein [Euryarchaeota archaeon]MDE1879025.1 DUF998 domain-containing protein [Euryarchaeota archaeon]MDE2044208.1 DUF998 domain-containing protein [Thermoplasmata archaeon]
MAAETQEDRSEVTEIQGPQQLPPFRFPLWRFFSWLVRWLKVKFPPFGFWAGIFAVFYFWASVSLDAYLNRSWWIYQSSSLSALGDPGPNCSSAAAGLYWFYNDVVIFPTAILLMLFSAALVMYSRNRVQSTGASFFLVAGIFLFLVGIYHGETSSVPTCDPSYVVNTPYPPAYHDFVSDWFFIQALFSMIIFGFGLLLERRYELGYTFLSLAVFTPLLVFGLDQKSVGLVELGAAAFLFLLFDIIPLLALLGGEVRALASVRRCLDGRFALGYQLVLPALLLPLFVARLMHSTGISVAENETIGIIAIDLVAALMLFARRPARDGRRP